MSSYRATTLRRGSWDYEFLSSRGVRCQYPAWGSQKEFNVIIRLYGVEFSLYTPRPVAQSHPKSKNTGYENHPTFYYLTRIQIQKLILLINKNNIVLIER